MRAVIALVAAVTLSACVAPTQNAAPNATGQARSGSMSMERALQVTRAVEPVAERVCRSQTPGQNCNFTILLDRNPRAPVNAFQTVDPETGRPVIILTASLIRAVRNDDELAFVIGHEAAHHIAEHIQQQRAAAQAGARIFGAVAQQQGATREEIIEAAGVGALVGSRRFSQAAELEADALGTIIACQAGFDAEVGARFFSQLPDPGAQILGTHPPNAERVRIVAETSARVCR
ncbi:M48 family metallopeptidase [Gymnodinialimonas mytili]|uniref:M48 family metallopeptidase n=1 Tax=Gymnodinialimonas mytili TaxID=3126503 RepID=UPI0030EE12D9